MPVNPHIYMMVTFMEDGVGGVEILVMRTAGDLAASGEKVSIITCYFVNRAKRGERFCFKKSMNGITIYRIPAFEGFTMLNTFLFLTGSFIVLLPSFRKYAVLHAFQVYSSGVIACLLRKIFKIKVVVQGICGGSIGDIAELKQMPFSRCFIKNLKKADVYITPSAQVAKELVDIGFLPDKIKTVAHGVDVNVFKPFGNREDDRLNREKLSLSGTKNVAFVGRLSMQKRPLFLLETWNLVIKKCPQSRLLIFGKGELEDDLKKLCKEKGLESSVDFMGVIKDLLPYYQATDVFVLPSYAEGVSIALLEAMSCGLAVVTSNIPGNAEVIRNGENGLLFEVEDKEECARKIIALLTNKQLAEKLKGKARRTVMERYSSDAMAKAFIEIYRGIFPE